MHLFMQIQISNSKAHTSVFLHYDKYCPQKPQKYQPNQILAHRNGVKYTKSYHRLYIVKMLKMFHIEKIKPLL